MYIVGEAEAEAAARVIREGALFRYGVGGECDRFEARYAAYLSGGDSGARHVTMTVSGTYALTAALVAAGIGPGDEVLVPAHTYMATATAVLAAGAIPVIVDVDESITIDATALEDAIGPRTRAVIPVHMWGAACGMDAIMSIAQRRGLIVIEDACQAVGGAYEGRALGTIGLLGAFSFNYYKNMTAGEGGAVVTNDPDLDRLVRCAVDPCHFYWDGREDGFTPFAGLGARASEISGAILNVQLDRLPDMISAMRHERRRVLAETAHLEAIGLRQSPVHSPDYDCAAHAFYLLPTADAATRFAELASGVVAGKTGRHNYTEWDQVLAGAGAAHPAMNPFNFPQNRDCRREYHKEMCLPSLDILDRTVLMPMDPRHDSAHVDALVHNIDIAARVALDGLDPTTVELRDLAPFDRQKFDLAPVEGS
jgi:dTDP-4-amino-4,6-dideoxygalactose transaminase